MSDAIIPLVGQILGIAVAGGLNLYATVAALGIGARLEWFEALPDGLHGIEDTLIIASASLLFLIEFVIDKIRHVDSLWDTVHTIIRPAAVALLAFAVLTNVPQAISIAGATLAGVVALATHTTKAGLRLTLNARPSTSARRYLSITEDALAIGLAIAAIQFPLIALSIAAAAFVILTFVGPRLWRAFVLGLRALAARIREPLGYARWRTVDELPTRFRDRLDPASPGRAEPRAARAALEGIQGAGAYRNGWLVITDEHTIFLYRSLLSVRQVTLPPIRNVTAREGVWADRLDLETTNGPCTLFLLKDGPPTELALAEFGTSQN